MSYQETPTKLSLWEWARIMGVNPAHFFGIQFTDIQITTCARAWFQYEWQATDAVGREQVAQAIADAEEAIESHLHYRLLPDWEVDEWHRPTRAWRPESLNLGARNLRGFANTVDARWGHVISGGIRSKELVQAAAAITWSSTILPADYEETGTVTVATVALDPQEIALYHPGYDGDERYRIRPVSTSIAGGTATITFRRELAVLPDFYLSMDLDAESSAKLADGKDDADFESTVDVYRIYNDPQSQAAFLWEQPASPSCGVCSGSGCASCQYTTQTGCLLIRGDPAMGMLGYRPATWDSDELDFVDASWAVARDPDIVRLYYYAGLRDRRLQTEKLTMHPQWARAVAYYAASMLDRPPCTCFQIQWERWAQDRAFSGGADEHSIYRISARDLDNPLGTRAGALFAWRLLSRPGARIPQAIPTM